LTGSLGFTGVSSLRAWVGGGASLAGGGGCALSPFGGSPSLGGLEGKGGGREVGGWAGTLMGSLGFTGPSSRLA
jgi:hypothetical protein